MTTPSPNVAAVERDVEARSAVFKKELGVFYAATYLVLFAIPLIGMKAFAVRAPWWLKIACVSGFLATVVYIGYAPVPITPVKSQFWFAFKIIATVLVANAVGIAVYVLGKRRSV